MSLLHDTAASCRTASPHIQQQVHASAAATTAGTSTFCSILTCNEQIMDTDAEGRLTLADALVFAEQLGVEAIVDIATREQPVAVHGKGATYRASAHST